jgi:insertion element IS1 protein InsB
MLIREACPACGSSRYKKNGHPRHGKQHHQCTACDRPLGATADDRRISEAQRTRVEHLLRERPSRRGLCRAVGVRLPWLWHRMVPCVADCPDALPVQLPTRPTDGGRRRLDAAADERGSFGQRKANKPWRWLAMDAITRQILAFHGGNRRRDRAKAL